MKYTLSILIVLLGAMVAQAQEVQVPIDSAGLVNVFTAEMEGRLHLFTEYSGFEEARLFQRHDSSFFLEISFRDGGKLTRVHFDKTPDEVASLRHIVSEDAQVNKPEEIKLPASTLDQSSRTKFLVWETLLSTFAYGPLIISSADVGAGAASGLELIIGGSGFLVPYLLTEHGSMTDGESSLALGGAFNGLFHGSLIAGIVSDNEFGSEWGVLAAGTSILETIAGYSIAHRYHFSEGKSDIIRYGGFFGMSQGAGIAGLIDPELSPEAFFASSLAGSGLGYFFGNILSQRAHYTRGDATVALTAGIYGTYCAYMLLAPQLRTSSSNEAIRMISAIGLAGNLGGLWLAHSLGMDHNLSTEQGTFVLLGTSAGFLIGSGIGLLIELNVDFDNITDVYGFTIPSVLGTAAGFAISYAAFSGGSKGSMGSNWDLNFNPGAMMAALAPKKTSSTPSYVAPALSFTYHW